MRAPKQDPYYKEFLWQLGQFAQPAPGTSAGLPLREARQKGPQQIE